MPAQQQQSGFALLLFMVVMIGFITAGFSGLLTSSVKQKNEQAKVKTQQALLRAKEALLSYAVDYKIQNDLDQMGKLPCPDVTSGTNLEGSQDLSCGATSVNSIGLFPFKTFGLGKIEDANGECLWYVVTGDYKNAPAAKMLNWDSVGYLNVVDENGNLKHSSSQDEYPIALIISPGKALNGQDRSPDAALPECHANFNADNYLEGGVNIDYSTDHPATADTLWQFLDTSESAYLENADHNDQVIAIYRSELWDRVEALNDLAFDNSDINIGVPDPVTTEIEKLTRSLAECIAAYGNSDTSQHRLPYPAPLNLTDYRVNNNYDDVPTNYGRFPQVVNSSITLESKFVLDTALTTDSYCEAVTRTLPYPDPLGLAYDELLWKNWKDHFFYAVSESFDPSSTSNKNAKCVGVNNQCMEIILTPSNKKIAATVIFAGKLTPDNVIAVDGNIGRIWWNDATTGLIDEKDKASHYLEGDDAVAYTGGNQTYNMTSIDTDYAYCIIQAGSPPFTLSAVKCNDL